MLFTRVVLNIKYRAWNLAELPPLSLAARLGRDDDDALPDLWERREGLRKAIKEILAGGNIPTHVVTLIYPAGAACGCILGASSPLLPPPLASPMLQ